MSLKIIKFNPLVTRIAVIAVVAAGALFGFRFVSWSFANALAENGLDPKVAESRALAAWLPQISPADPQTHIAAARYFERTFETDDLGRVMVEYEAAAAAGPADYRVWLLLARARDRTGDVSGAEDAYRRAHDLAPNYSAVNWAYGNSLLRHGQPEEGFRLVAAAAAADHQYRAQAAVTALQVFDNDPIKARRALGETPEMDAIFAEVLASQKRFAEAAASWSRIPESERATIFIESGRRLSTSARAANEFRIGALIAADTIPDGSERPETGKLINGGFEQGIKLRDPQPFEWLVAEGTEPQIGLSEGVRRSGRYSLFLTFNSFETANSFRSIAQLVPVEPGGVYDFSGFYRADLTTKAEFRWEIVEALSSRQIAVTEPLGFAGDWTTMKVRFTVPPTTDGIVIRFVRLNCSSGACPVTGRMAFDDLALTRVS